MEVRSWSVSLNHRYRRGHDFPAVGSELPRGKNALAWAPEKDSLFTLTAGGLRAIRRGQQELERLSSEAAKYGTAKVLKRTARAEVPLHVSGARPSWGPHPGLPWPQRPLQEDQSAIALPATQRTNHFARRS